MKTCLMVFIGKMRTYYNRKKERKGNESQAGCVRMIWQCIACLALLNAAHTR